MEKKISHLQFIEESISRMANNSFLLKGWSITLIAALFALAAKDSNSLFIILAFFPLIMFWILDSYYLSHERYFRNLYDEVRQKEEVDIDFSMRLKKLDWTIFMWIKAFFSLTIGVFYGTIIVILLMLLWFI